MSHFDYIVSRDIESQEYPFYALIMACIRQADDVNIERLHQAFPDVVHEFRARYNAPNGYLPAELRVAYPQVYGEGENVIV